MNFRTYLKTDNKWGGKTVAKSNKCIASILFTCIALNFNKFVVKKGKYLSVVFI